MTVQAPVLYQATVGHTRSEPIANSFSYQTFYWLVDIDQPPVLFWPLRWLASFDARDHLDIRSFLADHGLVASRIYRLAHARSLSAAFNPISVYWCYGPNGALVATVAEVHNTYGGRHAYLLELDASGKASMSKQMYVSPFYPVEGSYDVRVSEPDEDIAISVTLKRPDARPFVATLRGARRPFTIRTLLMMWLRHPWTPLRDSLLIRFQGLRLWRRGLEIYPR